MTKGVPAAMPVRKASRYGSSAVVVESMTPAAVSVLPVTRPRPGKCLSVVAMPACAMPLTTAEPWLPTVAGSCPYSRWSAPIGWFVASAPGGTTSITGAKLRLMPAVASSPPHWDASACRTAGERLPCSSADGIVENPGPFRRWISPPSWSAPTKKPTPPVADLVANAWMAVVKGRMLSMPPVRQLNSQMDPR